MAAILVFQKMQKIFDKFGHKVFVNSACKIGREKEQGRGNDSCHICDQYFLPCFPCKHPAILFQNKNGIFQHKNQTIN